MAKWRPGSRLAALRWGGLAALLHCLGLRTEGGAVCGKVRKVCRAAGSLQSKGRLKAGQRRKGKGLLSSTWFPSSCRDGKRASAHCCPIWALLEGASRAALVRLLSAHFRPLRSALSHRRAINWARKGRGPIRGGLFLRRDCCPSKQQKERLAPELELCGRMHVFGPHVQGRLSRVHVQGCMCKAVCPRRCVQGMSSSGASGRRAAEEGQCRAHTEGSVLATWGSSLRLGRRSLHWACPGLVLQQPEGHTRRVRGAEWGTHGQRERERGARTRADCWTLLGGLN